MTDYNNPTLTLAQDEYEQARRIIALELGTGTVAQLPIYTVASKPAAASYTGAIIYCSNGDAGSPCLAVSNGTSWLRVALGAAVAAS